MTVEEERSRNEQSMETKERLERNEKERSSLMAALKMEREERERESAELDRLEERLKADTKARQGASRGDGKTLPGTVRHLHQVARRW